MLAVSKALHPLKCVKKYPWPFGYRMTIAEGSTELYRKSAGVALVLMW